MLPQPKEPTVEDLKREMVKAKKVARLDSKISVTDLIEEKHMSIPKAKTDVFSSLNVTESSGGESPEMAYHGTQLSKKKGAIKVTDGFSMEDLVKKYEKRSPMYNQVSQ